MLLIREAPQIETERLVLRPWRKDDFDSHFAIVSDPEVMRHFSGPIISREDSWRRLAASVGSWPLLGFGGWAVTRRSDRAIVGMVSLFNAWRALEPEFGEEPEMGWIFATEVHGQGIASEACRAGLDWAEASLEPTPVWAIIDPSNAPSFRLAERLGFERLSDTLYNDEPTAVLKRPAWS
ncbi:MAG: GNAT family N-acetyltransferase [Sphingomicrobium sp.]